MLSLNLLINVQRQRFDDQQCYEISNLKEEVSLLKKELGEKDVQISSLTYDFEKLEHNFVVLTRINEELKEEICHLKSAFEDKISNIERNLHQSKKKGVHIEEQGEKSNHGNKPMDGNDGQLLEKDKEVAFEIEMIMTTWEKKMIVMMTMVILYH